MKKTKAQSNLKAKIAPQIETPQPPTTAEKERATKPATKREEKISQLLKDRPIYVNSIASGLIGLDNGSVLREMQNARNVMLRFYMGEQGGKLSLEEAKIKVDTYEGDVEEAVGQLLSQPVDMASWYGLEKLHSKSPELAKTVWQWIKDEARREFESGHRAAKAFEPVHWIREAWRRAQYIAIRESFIEQWKPQGGIELAMIDMLVQSYYLYLYWNEVSVTRNETEMRSDPPAWIMDKAYREKAYPRERQQGYWNPPYAHEQEAVEHAAQMADRYLRAFQRTLRAMRDLRRYSTPVTINNPQQVNIAADGGQQVNIAKDQPISDS
ncbi:MAG: hypothetical protein ABI977_09770 [Acidobacteriota bacterium]